MIFNPCKPLSYAVMLALFSGGVAAETLTIQSASDWGGAHSSYPASNAIDGDTSWSSRWAAQNAPVNLVLDLGSVQNVQDVKIAWGKGEQQTYKFEVRALADEGSSTWDKIYNGYSSGTTSQFETYDVQDVQAVGFVLRSFLTVPKAYGQTLLKWKFTVTIALTMALIRVHHRLTTLIC